VYLLNKVLSNFQIITDTNIAAKIKWPPVLAIIPDQTVDEGMLLTFAVSATDQDTPSAKLSYRLEEPFPTGASINSTNGVLTWTPTKQQAPSTNLITVRVTDDSSPPLTDTKSFTVVVNRINSPPVIPAIPDQNASEGAPFSLVVQATDPDGPGQQLTFSLDEAVPAGAAIAPNTGAFTWTPSEQQGPSTNLFTVKVTDNGVPPLSATNSFTVVVSEVNLPPVLSVPGTQTLDELTPLMVRITAVDPDIPANVLAFSLAEPQAGVSIDLSTGVLTWTPIEAQGPSTNIITLRVTDNGVPSLTATNSFTVIVNEVNLPPSLAAIPDQTVDEGVPLSLTVTATDPDLPAQTLRFSLESDAPAGARVDPVSGLFTWTPSEEQGPGTNRITVRVTDSGIPGLSDTRAFSVIVREVNSTPVISALADRIVEENSRLEFAVEATDPDAPKNAVTFALGSDAPAGATIDPRTGVFSWTTPAVAAAQTNRITVRITDDGSPPMQATAIVQVLVTPAKLRLAQIPDRTEDEGTVIAFGASVMDSPLAQPPFTYALETRAPAGALISPNSGAFLWQPTEAEGPSTNRITVRVTDSSNPPLTASRSFTVIVREVNRPPVLEAIVAQKVAAGQPLRLNVKAQDPDLPANELTYSLEPGAPVGPSIDAKTGLFSWTPGPLAAGGTNSITVKVTDNGSPPLGHTATFAVAVTVPEGPKLAGVLLPNGQFQLTLNGETGRIYLIQFSADLAAWEPLTNILSASTAIQIVDPLAPGVRQRFYRALSP